MGFPTGIPVPWTPQPEAVDERNVVPVKVTAEDELEARINLAAGRFEELLIQRIPVSRGWW